MIELVLETILSLIFFILGGLILKLLYRGETDLWFQICQTFRACAFLYPTTVYAGSVVTLIHTALPDLLHV